MNIGIDASRYSHPEATGVEWYSWHIINGIIKFAEKNDQIVLYSKKPLNVDAKNVVVPGKRLWTLRHLSKVMRKSPPDVLFVPSHVLPLKVPRKSVITIHDVAFHHLRKSYSFVQYHYLNWSTKFAVKHASRIIVPSEATKRDLIHFFNCPDRKIKVVYHGFEEPTVPQKKIDAIFETSDVFKYFDIKKESRYILFVGRLESKKNLVHLVQAFKDFLETHPDFQLVLAGKRGVGFEKIMKTVNELQIASKVAIPGYITEDEKAALFKYCSVFAFPSLYEGFGLPILESFYYKKPVLAANVSCLPEVGGEAVHYIDPYDPSSIAMGLDKLINDEKYSKNLVTMGSERLKMFTWEEASKKTLEILKST